VAMVLTVLLFINWPSF